MSFNYVIKWNRIDPNSLSHRFLCHITLKGNTCDFTIFVNVTSFFQHGVCIFQFPNSYNPIVFVFPMQLTIPGYYISQNSVDEDKFHDSVSVGQLQRINTYSISLDTITLIEHNYWCISLTRNLGQSLLYYNMTAQIWDAF